MANLNKVLLIGNITRDPEVRYIPSGTAVTDLGVAVNSNWTGKDGQKHEEVTFVDVTVWGRQAELAGEYLNKGKAVFIEGRLQLDQWQDKEGQKRQKLRVVADRWQFVGSGGGKGGEPGGRGGEPAADRKAAAPHAEDFGESPPPSEPPPSEPPQGDIPF